MLINADTLPVLTQAVNAMFLRGLARTKPNWNVLAMEVPSTTAENIYPYLRQLGSIRKWIGDRIKQNLAKGEFKIVNDDWEETHGIPRKAIEDDQYGLYSNLFEQTGYNVGVFPDKLVFDYLTQAFTTIGPDGQYIIDVDHPVGAPGQEASVSNFGGGSGTAWFLVDSSKPIKPLIYQPRKRFDLQSFFDPKDPNVFWQKEFVWGTDGRAGVGPSPYWQLIYGSKQTVDATNVKAAMTAMRSYKGDDGEPLDVMATHFVCGPSLEMAANALFNKATLATGETNDLNGRLQVVVSGRLA